MAEATATDVTADVLSLDAVERWRESLAVLDPDASDAGRVDLLRSLEELKCAAEAAQARLSVELDASMRADAHLAGVVAERQGRGVAAQVGLARRVSGNRGERLLSLAKVVSREMPYLMAAWTAGKVSERRVIDLARETACLDLRHRHTIDRDLASDADRLSRMGDKQAAGEAARMAAELDPAGVADRRRRAERDRHTSLRPAPDTMTRFSALLPVKDGVAIHAVLGVEADRLHAAGDDRTRGQIMADTLRDRVLQRATGTATAPDPTKWNQPAGTVFGSPSSVEPVALRDPSTGSGQAATGAPPQGPASEPGVMVNLIVSDEILPGDRHGGGWVEGHGPVPGDLLREWIADRLDAQGADATKVWLRRVYASPKTGDLVAMDSTARRFTGRLAEFLRLRDRLCRIPWCDAPIRHLDHVEEHADGGETSSFNDQGLCEAHNYAKQARGWKARPRPGPDDDPVAQIIETLTPTGHVYESASPNACPKRPSVTGGHVRGTRVEIVWAG